MAQGARIYSVDAIKQFRAALIKFAESGNVALSSGDGDIDRVLGWLERDQSVYWAGQVRKRHALVLQWEDAVRQKRLYKNFDGTTKSAVDEQKALQKAKRDEEEAVQKCLTVKKAIGVLRKESMMYKGRVQRLATALQSDIPTAVHALDTMLDHIAAYLQLQTAGQGIDLSGSVESISKAAASAKVGLERYRERTPTPEQRLAAVLTLVGPDHPMREPWKTGAMQDWQKKALDGLSLERQLPDPDLRVVLSPDVWQSPRIYLERLEAASDQDSGWYIGPAGEENPPATDAPELIAVRLGDVIASRPDFADLLNLPTGSLVIVDGGGPAAIFDQLGLDIWALALIKAAEPAEAATEAPSESAAPAAETEQPAATA
jgi:hypothetical protein